VSNTIRIKRSTATATPTTLANAELAFSENSSTLFIGVGTGGAGGSATSIVAIGGPGKYATLDTAQTISGAKTFTGSVGLSGATVTGLTTTSVGEGTNLYYTDVRARTSLSVTAGSGLTYNSSTGVFGLGSIPNSALANNSITINGIATPLGGSTTTTAVTTSIGGTLTLQGTAGEVEVGTSGSTFTFGLPDSVLITSALTVGTNLTVTGDLTVNGTTTTINSTTISVDDKNLELGSTASPTDAGADGGGITLRGTTDKTLSWVDATDAWTSSEHLELAATKTFRINGASVLNATGLGTGVLASSLTSVGALTAGSLGTGFTTIAVAQGGTGATTLTGVLKGNGTGAFTAAVAGTDYLSPDSVLDCGTF